MPRFGFLAIAVSPSTSALTTQSTRPEAICSITSSRVFSDVMVAFGAKRRATASLAEPTSTAIFTSGLLMSAQVLASKPFLQHGAERVRKHEVGEIDHQRALRRRVERKAEIDLVGLQVEDRIAVGGLGVFQLDVEQLGDVVRHLDGQAGPGAGGEILVEIGQLARQHGDAQHLVGADAIERVVGGRLRRGGGVRARTSAPRRCRSPAHSAAPRGDLRKSSVHRTGTRCNLLLHSAEA